MSLEDGDSLPLITEPQCIVDVPGLHSAWTALLKLREEVTRGRATLERNTGPLTLALKYLQAKLGRTRDNAPDKATKAALGSAAGALAQATRWLLQQIRGRTHGYDSLSLSVLTAQAELEQLSSPNPPASRHRKLHVGHCRLVWELIDLTIQETPLQKIVKANVVKGSLKKLDAITRHAIEGKTVSFYQSHLRRSTPSKRQVDSTAAIRKIIQISDHDRQILNRYLQDAVPVPTQGLVKAPSKLTMSEVKTLLPGRWVDDRIIDAYLKLVCHHGNGLFDAIDQGDDQSARTGTPKYHAWSSLVAEGPGHMDISWPPEQYAAPKIEEVQHHFFPLLVGHDGGERNHWIMLHLWNNAGSWALDCFSSMAGYHGDENWPYLAQELFQMSNRVLDVTTLRPTDPILQPRQINDSDCGALILYVARWIMEGWPIWTIQSDLCGTYRRRLIVELEKWRLD